MTTHLLSAGKAAWVNKAASSTTYHDRPALTLDGTGADVRQAYLWFPNPLGRQGDNILSATLTLYLANAWTGPTVITASRITQSWKQDTVHYGASGATPSFTTTNAATTTVTAGAANDAVSIDITAMLRDVQAGGAWYGVLLTIDSNGPLRVWSPKAPHAAYRPTLLVSMSIEPDAPDTLHPNGTDFAQSDAEPVFRWNFASADADAYQAYSRVQVSETSGDYSSPDYDSGWQANEQTSWDSSLDTTSPVLSDGTTYYWQVAVRDQNGLESDYSDEATYLQQATGDMYISDPAVDLDTVADTTPTITWWTNNLVQTHVRIRVYDSSDGATLGTLLYTRDWEAQAQDYVTDGDLLQVGYDMYTVPTNVPDRHNNGDAIITTANAYYAVIVDVRDDVSRRDDDYVTDTRFFQYVPTALTAAAALTKTSAATAPYVTFTFTRASEPDFWVITRDGVKIDEVEGGTLFVSGTTYSYTDWTAAPGHTYAYNVRAKTSGTGVGTAVASNLSVSIAPVGVWLLDPDLAASVCILGDTEIQQALAETSASLTPLNRRDAVRVVSRIGGYEGQVAGTIADWLNVSAATYLATLEDTVGRRSTERLRLVFGVRNIPVNVGALTVSQRPVIGNAVAMFDVSFNYYQVGGYTVAVN